MQFLVIQRIVGLLLMAFSLTLLPPLLLAVGYGDGATGAFLLAFAITFTVGTTLWYPVHRRRHELRLRDGFVVVVLFWLTLGLFGALPFFLAAAPGLSFSDAVFESVSGLTTTGATVITGLDTLPHAILYYRQQLQWLGGMGIIVLAIAVAPMLGIGGMQIFRADMPGTTKDHRLAPRVTDTAKTLWYIYLSLTALCALGYWGVGMSLFDAVGHAFSTIATGGFSTHDASLGYFSRLPLVEPVAILFMFLGGINFTLHFAAFRHRTLRPYLGDGEVKTYLALLAAAAAVTGLYLFLSGTYRDPGSALAHGLFQAVSIGTTTGYTTAQYYTWPGFIPILLLFVSFIGGCANSTAGGMKAIRFQLLLRQGAREIARLIHPNAVIPIKVGGRNLPDRVIDAVWGFFAAYVALFALMLLALMMFGLDQVSAFSAVTACLNNLGPGIGAVAGHYDTIPAGAKWILVCAMLLGRLEIFTLLVLFTPTFWRK